MERGKIMANEASPRRMTLRQLLTHTEKTARELQQHLSVNLLSELADYRQLSRPVRRRSHYPTLITVQNAYRKLMEVNDQVQLQARQLEEALHEIREHAKREIVNRL
jgi:hypothetical protein